MIRRCCCNPVTPPGVKCNVCGGLCPYDAECGLFPPNSGPGLITRCRVATPHVCCRTYTVTAAGTIAPIHCPAACTGVTFTKLWVCNGQTIGLSPIPFTITHNIVTPQGGGYCFVEPQFTDPAPTTYAATIPSCYGGGTGPLKMQISATLAYECARLRLTIGATWSLARCGGPPNYLCTAEIGVASLAFSVFYDRTGWTGCPIAGVYNLAVAQQIPGSPDVEIIDNLGCTPCCDFLVASAGICPPDTCGVPANCAAEVTAAMAAQLPQSLTIA